MRPRSLIAIVAAGGVAAGATAAIAIPTTRIAQPATDRPFARLSNPITSAPARKRELGPTGPASVYMRARPGTVHLEARRPDPAGGPDWALRVYEADRMIPKGIRRPGSDGVIGVGLCSQLGRVVGGRFGWIDGANVFRPLSTAAFTGSPAACGSRTPDARKRPELHVTTLVGHPESQSPSLLGSVVWGVVGHDVRRPRLSVSGRTRGITAGSAHGAFIDFVGPSGRIIDAVLDVGYPDGSGIRTHAAGSMAGSGSAVRAGGRRPPFVPGSTRVMARTFDPGGGSSWGARATRTTGGDWCLGPAGHLVGDRVGEIDTDLGTLVELPEDSFPNGCSAQVRPSRIMPVQFVSSGGSYVDVPQSNPGRSLLRLERGRSFLWGRAAPDVEQITIATPRDVRTVEPSGPAHGFIVVYDGTGFGGDVEVTAHFRDGTNTTLKASAAW